MRGSITNALHMSFENRRPTRQERNSTEDFIVNRVRSNSSIINNVNQSQQKFQNTEFDPEDPTSSISRQGTVINKHLKLSSIHSAYSEMLIRMEYDGMKKNLRRKRTEERKKDKIAKNIAMYMENKGQNAKGLEMNRETPNNPIPINKSTRSSNKTKRNHQSQQWMTGAPKNRRILSLSPQKFKRRKIWTPHKEQFGPKQKNININFDLCDIKKKSRENIKNHSSDKQELLKESDNSNINNREVIIEDEENVAGCSKSSNNKELNSFKLISNKRKLYKKRQNRQHSRHSSSSSSETEIDIEKETLHRRTKKKTTKPMLGPRKVFYGDEVVPRPVKECPIKSTPKLSNFKRNIVYDESVIPKPHRQDKTPYLGNIPVPWIGSNSIPNNTDTSKSNSTPSDINEESSTPASKNLSKLLNLSDSSASASEPPSSLQVLRMELLELEEGCDNTK